MIEFASPNWSVSLVLGGTETHEDGARQVCQLSFESEAGDGGILMTLAIAFDAQQTPRDIRRAAIRHARDLLDRLRADVFVYAPDLIEAQEFSSGEGRMLDRRAY